MTRSRVTAGAALVAALAVPAAAQQVFRSGTEVVLLSVTVVDRQGHHVGGLQKADFRVFEDGILQEITSFANEPMPIALSLLVDTSVSMEPRLSVAREAAAGFVRRLGTGDVAQIIAFDSQARILQGFTGERAGLEASLGRLQVGGSTSLYNAVYTALSELRRLRVKPGDDIRRQAIVLLSDGEDTTSVVPFDEVLGLAKRSDVMVYSIGLRGAYEPPTRGWNEALYALRSLAQDTGGRTFSVTEASELPTIYQQIADELSNQYEMGYVSRNPLRDGAWRRIVVQAAREGAQARTKAGYFAPSGRR